MSELARPVNELLAGLDAARLAQLARRYQTVARKDGAYVTLADGARVAIPPILTPVVLAADERRALAADARRLVEALARTTRYLIEEGDGATQALLFGVLSPFEREAMARTHRDAERLATVRVDFLVGSDGVARALEVNATIPAMQGYSDAIAGGLLRALAHERGLGRAELDEVLRLNGRNSDDLLASLLASAELPAGRPARIAIVARPGDAQGGELDHYVRRWCALGHEVWRATPDEITNQAGALVAGGRRPDVTYRHVFLRRLDERSAFARMLLSPRAHGIWNPPASHLELKATLGLLSAANDDDGEAAAIGLTPAERDTVARRLPWTRVLRPGPGRGPDGATLADLVAFTRAHATRLVLKRSWDYGGRGVFLGAELDDEGSQLRLRALTGRDGPVDWDGLVDHALASGEAWVVQALVDVLPRHLLRVDATGPEERELYADLSAFTSLGNDVPMEGGAVRASGGRIVNIQGGGGLAPLLRAEAVARLFAARVD